MFVQQLVNGISLGSMYALLAVGFAIVYNILGIVNFSHGATIALGAYCAYWLSTYLRLPLELSMVLSVTIAGLVSALIERITLHPLRRKGQPQIFFFIASLTVFNLVTAIIIYVSKANITSYPRTLIYGSIRMANVIVPKLDVLMLGIAVLSLLALSAVLYKTKIGLAIRCCSYDSRAAQLMGINPDLVIGTTFLLAGLLGGIGGALLGAKYAVYPEIGDMVYRAFFACMVGGLGSLTGAIFGGLLIGMIETVSNAYINAAISPAITFGLLVIILLVRPQGIAGKLVEDKI